jgi:hypothetical protein
LAHTSILKRASKTGEYTIKACRIIAKHCSRDYTTPLPDADSGVYDLIHPNTFAEVSLNEGEMYGFRYSLHGKAGTSFKIELDDEVLAEGELDKSEAASGSGVV